MALFQEFEIDGDDASEHIRDVYNALSAGGLITRSVDMIPYTEDFDRLYTRISKVHALTKHEVFTRLMNERKKGKCMAPGGKKLAECQ